jgi:hypothetical protein
MIRPTNLNCLSMEEAVELMHKIEVGDTCTLVLKRGDEEVTIPIKAE